MNECLLINKNNSKMRKAMLHQPIYLARFRKKDKENAPINVKAPLDKDNNIEYDLLVFQQSLQYKKQNTGSEQIPQSRLGLPKQPLRDCSSLMLNSLRVDHQGSKAASKMEGLRELSSTGPVMTRLQFNKNFKQMRNMHRTSASYKPQISCSQNRTNRISLEPNVPKFKFNHGSSPQKQRDQQVNTDPIEEQPRWNQDDKVQKRQEKIKQDYEEIIKELKTEKEELKAMVSRLAERSEAQQREKTKIMQRMDIVEKEMGELIEETMKVREIELELVQKCQQYEEASVQTEDIKDNESQTNVQSCVRVSLSNSMDFSGISMDFSRVSVELKNQDWYLRAKSLKNELQWYKVHCAGLQSSLQVSLKNKEIEWSLQFDKLQKQFKVLEDKYSSKCTEVREKDALLTRFITKKT